MIRYTRFWWLVVLLGLAIFPGAVSAQQPQEIHCKHFFFGYPTGTAVTNDLIIRDCYALSSNDETKFADWVAFRLTPQEVYGDLDLERGWRNDPYLDETETLEGSPPSKDDYRKAFAQHKYDRGHLAPLASFKGSRHASEVNYYSNIVPQKSDLNQGPWQRLEGSVRDLVKRYQVVWVMTGTLYEQDMPKLPEADEHHKVPSGFWQIVIVQPEKKLDSILVAGFIFEQNTSRNAKLVDHLKSIEEIENRSKLDFLRLLPDDVEANLQRAVNQAWVIKEFSE
jgi:endonuclease G